MTTTRRPIALVLMIATALSLAGCGSSSPTTTTGGSIGLSLSATSASLAPGGQTAVTGTVTRSGGFTGNVAISVSGVPTGVTGSVGTVSTTGTSSSAIVTIAVASTTATGTYPIAVTASGTGVSSVSATYTLTVAGSAQSYTLSLSPTGAPIVASGTATTTVTINRSNFTGSVNLSVPNLPTGFTAAFAPNNTTGNTSTLTVTAPAGVAAGSYQLSVGGVASGQADQLAFFTVTVAASGSYTVAVAPTAVSVVQGSSNTATVTLTRTGGFSGNIGLTAGGNPALLGVSFAPSLVTGTSSTVTFTANASQPTGTYPVTIHAAATGVGTIDAIVNVTVTAAGGSGNAVMNFSGCAASLQPIWFAYQDGSGPWTVVSGTNNVYQFPISQSVGGFAYVTQQSASANQTTVIYYTKFELTSAPIVYCPAPGTNTMNGTVANLAAGQQAMVSMGGQAAVASFSTPTFQLTKLTNGLPDLIAYRTNLLNGPSGSDRLIVRRAQQVQNLGTIPTLDFTGAEAVVPASGLISVPGAGAGTVTAQLTYFTSNCTGSGSFWFNFSATSSFTAYGVPASSQLASDFHDLIVGVSNGNNIVGVQEIFHAMGPRTINLPTTIATPAIAVVAGNYKRLQATYTIPSEYNSGTSFSYYDGTGTHSVYLTATSGYLGSSSAVLTMPVFSGLSGFLDSWEPPTGTTVNWGVQASGSNMTGLACQEGYRLMSDNVTGTN